ncbi:carbohydrate kinase family protein [Chloroflexota bacterium]
MKNIDCSVVGDAMIDISLPLSGIENVHSLAQGGAANTKMRLSFGGSTNIAFYITKLGGNSVFIGRVGDDYFGKIFLEDLEENGIPARVSVSKGENTGVVFVLVFPDGERFFIVDRGANAGLRYEDSDLDLIRDSKFFFFSGYSFQDKEVSDGTRRLLNEIINDTSIVFNPGAPNLAKEFKDSFTDVIGKYVSILILNEAEARYLTECSSEREMIDSLLSLASTVALTRGGRGSIIATKNEVHYIKANSVKVLDTTGAGDAYAAGFIYGLSQGWDVKTTGEFASRIAEQVVSQFGARVKFSTPSS